VQISGKKRSSTVFTVSFPTMPSLTTQPTTIEVYQEQYSHDVINLIYQTTSEIFFNDLKTGTPVTVYIKQEYREYTWFAYVTHTSKNVEGRLDKELLIQCVGATYPLKERTTKVFTETTITNVVEQIARENGFIAVVDSHPVVFPQLTIAGHSYWEWLAEQAKRIGYVLWADGTTIYFRNLDTMINKGASNSPLLFFKNSLSPAYTEYRERTLQEFRALKGENIETNDYLRTEKNLSGIDPLTLSRSASSVSPVSVGKSLRENVSDVLFSEYRTDQVVQSQRIADELTKGAASMARFNLPAKINCLGDPRIHPFAPVRIQGTGSETDGLWIIKTAKHTIRQNGEYYIDGIILTDGTGANYVDSLRPDIQWENGTVNIQEALLDSTVRGSSWTSELNVLGIAYTPGDNGYTRSPARWKATTVANGSHI
jgi:hypothetical protein